MVLPEHEHLYAFTRSLEEELLLVVCNVSGTSYRLSGLLPEALDAELLLGNLVASDPAVLGPWEARVLRLP
jgi:oligo-1,6-glucosidase